MLGYELCQVGFVWISLNLWLATLSSFLLALESSSSVLQLNVEQVSCSWEVEVSALLSGTVLVEGVGPGWEGELFM